MDHISQIPAIFYLIAPPDAALEAFKKEFAGRVEFKWNNGDSFYFNTKFGEIHSIIDYCDTHDLNIQLRG
jgi:hypothetical protein